MAVDDDEVRLLKALVCNKSTLNVSTGVLTIYDDDDVTPIAIITPTATADASGYITMQLVPSFPNSPGAVADPGDEIHQVKCALLNKRIYTIASGELEVKDDNGSTELFTLGKTEAGGVVTREQV